MNDELSRPRATYIAVFLAVLVLGAFWCLRYYGPESAVRRFHRAIQVENQRDIELSTIQAIDRESNVAMRSIAESELRDSRSYGVVDMKRSPKKVTVIVQYDHSNGTSSTLSWVVEYVRSSWRINTDDTLRLAQRQALGFP